MSRLFASMCTAAALVVAGRPGAGAPRVEREHYSGTDEFAIEDCEFPLSVVGTFSGHFRVKATKGGQAFLALDNYRYRDVVTNPETGKWFVIRANGVFHEIKATLVEGNVYEFEQHDAGQPFVVEDSDGHVVLRDRGVAIFTVVFDTLGDGMPGGEFIEEIDVSLRGPHPGFDADLCEIAAELTGAD